MSSKGVRSTLYLDPELHRALQLKAANAHRSMSDIVNAAVREALREDMEDLAVLRERAEEAPISHEELLAQLRAEGTL